VTAEELLKRENGFSSFRLKKNDGLAGGMAISGAFHIFYIVEGKYFVFARQPGITGAGGTATTPDANPCSGATVAPSANPNILIREG